MSEKRRGDQVIAIINRHAKVEKCGCKLNK